MLEGDRRAFNLAGRAPSQRAPCPRVPEPCVELSRSMTWNQQTIPARRCFMGRPSAMHSAKANLDWPTGWGTSDQMRCRHVSDPSDESCLAQHPLGSHRTGLSLEVTFDSSRSMTPFLCRLHPPCRLFSACCQAYFTRFQIVFSIADPFCPFYLSRPSLRGPRTSGHAAWFHGSPATTQQL